MTESPHTRDFSASAPLLRFAPPLETRFVGQDGPEGPTVRNRTVRNRIFSQISP